LLDTRKIHIKNGGLSGLVPSLRGVSQFVRKLFGLLRDLTRSFGMKRPIKGRRRCGSRRQRGHIDVGSPLGDLRSRRFDAQTSLTCDLQSLKHVDIKLRRASTNRLLSRSEEEIQIRIVCKTDARSREPAASFDLASARHQHLWVLTCGECEHLIERERPIGLCLGDRGHGQGAREENPACHEPPVEMSTARTSRGGIASVSGRQLSRGGWSIACRSVEGIESADVKSGCGPSVVGAVGTAGAVTMKPVPQYKQAPGAGP
jgi:hypothetical protein